MSGLLIPNTFDPKGKTPQIKNTNSLSVSGSGYILSITQLLIFSDSNETGVVTVVVDGVTYASDVPLSNKHSFNSGSSSATGRASNGSSNSISGPIRFESGFSVTGAGSANVRTLTTYLLD